MVNMFEGGIYFKCFREKL